MGNAYAPAPAAAAAKANASIPATKAKPAPDIDRGPFSPARALELLLRQASEQAYATASPGPGTANAAAAFVTALQAAVEIARAGTIDWSAGGPGIVSAVGQAQVTVEFLLGDLASVDPSLAATLPMTMTTLLALIPADVLAAAPRAGRVAPMTDTDRMELCRQAIAGVRKRLDVMPAITATSDVRSELAVFSEPLAAQMIVARDAALAIADRRTRWRLVLDVEQLSLQMDVLAGVLSMQPRVAWHPSFAAAFDAENDLRRAVGAPVRPRPFSGHIDPTSATRRLDELAKGTVGGPAAHVDLDPDTAVAQIGIAITRIFTQQKDAIDLVRDALSEKESPHSSLLGMLLNIAIDAAIGTVASAIGSLVSAAYKRLANLSSDNKSRVADLIKDGSKEAFKSFVKSVRNLPDSYSLPPLAAFVSEQKRWLEEASERATLESLGLANALRQAELPDLVALLAALNEAGLQAHGIQYASSMREWANLRAVAAAGPAMHFPIGHEADLRQRDVPGVLEIDMDYAHGLTLRSVRLNGGELAARQFLHDAALPLGSTKMNERYDIRIVGSGFIVSFGVGPDRGVQVETLGARQLAILRVLAADEPVTPQNVNHASNGGFAEISDDDARMVATNIVRLASRFTTASLEV